MSRFFNDLEAQLHTAAAARVAGRRPAPKGRLLRLRRGMRLAPVLAAVVVPLVVAGVVLMMVGSGGSGAGPAGPHPARPALTLAQLEARYFNGAFDKTVRHDPACGVRGLLDQPRGITTGTPEHALLSILSIMRRPPTSADKLPRIFGGVTGLGLPGYAYVRYIRFARVQARARYYVVVAHLPGVARPPSRCSLELRSTLSHAMPPSVPKPKRAQLLKIASRLVAHLGARPTHPYDGIYLVAGGDGGGAAGGGLSANRLKSTGLVGTFGRTVYGVVPDGVATVKLRLRPTRDQPRQTLTATVVNNVFVAQAPRTTLPMGEVWLSRAGAVIRRVNLNS